MVRVKEEMISDPVAAEVPGTTRELMKLFRIHGFAGFPVVKENSRKLAGVVTRHDLFQNPEETQTALLMDPNPATTYPEAPIEEVAELAHLRNLRLVPVVNGSNDLVGLVTPSELLAALHPTRALVSGYLKRRLVPVHHSTPAAVALEILRTTRATALPVLDDEARLIGIVTDGDILKRAKLEERTVRRKTGQVRDGDAWDHEAVGGERSAKTTTTRLRVPEVPVGQLMVGKVVTIGITTPVNEAARVMSERKLNQLPVLDGEGRLIDVLTDVDLLGAFLERRRILE